MNYNDIFLKVTDILEEELSADVSDVNDESSFEEDLGADSLDSLEVIMALEEEFGIEIPDEDIENMRYVGELVSYIQSNI